MITIGFGQNIIDHYYRENEYIGSSSGGSVWNIISNIASLGGKTMALGSVSGDNCGKIFIDEMKQLNVDISNINIKKKLMSNAMFIEIPIDYTINNDVKANYKCPVCGKIHWKSRKTQGNLNVSFFIEQDILLIIDNIKSENISVINELKDQTNKLVVAQDLGHKYNLRFKKIFELKEYFLNIDILQTKEEVLTFILSRMNMNIKEFMFECKILKIIVTNGERGCYIHECLNGRYKMEQYYPTKKYEVVDSSGAGDVFFARYLYKTIISEKIDNKEGIFEFCQEGVEKVLAGIGAKFNLQIQLKNLKCEERCDCASIDDNSINSSKTILHKQKFKCLTNYEAVQKKIQALQFVNIENGKQLFNQKGIILCIGTGASYISAVYITQLLLSMGRTAIAIYPFEISIYSNIDIKEILIFTTSGRTYDNKKVAKECQLLFDKAIIRLVTTADKRSLVENYAEEVVDNSIIYQTDFSHQEHGFLSFWGVFGPAVYLTLLASDKNNMYKQALKNIGLRFKYWDKNQEIDRCIASLLEKHNKAIDVIYSSKHKAAALALESMFTESGIYRCLLHEEKNFSHGRFVISEHIPAGCVIIIKDVNTTDYEQKLIDYLKKQDVLLLTLEAETEFPRIDAIIATYSWMVKYALKSDRDISKPTYTNDSMKLYKFK